MDARLQRRVQRYGWDKAAPSYERAWQAQLEPAQTAMLGMAPPAPGARTLDVACGTGLVTLRAAALADPQGSVVGTDISEQMVVAARERAIARGIEHVRFERMDAEDLKFAGDSFDTVLCGLGLMYVPDPQKAIREFHRVLRPGGRAAAAVWGQRRNCGWAEIFPIVDARVQSEVCPMFFGLGTGQTLSRSFAAAGFRDVREQRLDTRLQYTTADEACEAAFAGGPVALAYDRFSQDTRDEAHKEYLASLEPYRHGGRYSVPGEFVIVVGTK
jgi:ubiquinone/menaquinone biosynthesis C-methylase UbiE